MTSRRSLHVVRFSRRFRNLLSMLLCAALLLAPLPAVPYTKAAGPMQTKSSSSQLPAFAFSTWLAAVRSYLSFQPVPNLDTMRAGTPQPPTYSSNSTLPPAGYDDPKPQLTGNYHSYFTQLVHLAAASGPAGALPLQAADPTSGSASVGGVSINLDNGNFNYAAPVLSVAGRAGLDLSLALSYSSNVWLKDTNTGRVVFNADRGFPAPGWRLGFGAIQVRNSWGNWYVNGVTERNSIIYLAPDGTRHDLQEKVPGSFIYESYDSTYLKYDANVNQSVLYFPNGTQMKFGAFSGDASNFDFQLLPTRTTDRNGNYIDIFYKTLNSQKVVLDYVIDTAGRRIDFNYQNNRLTSISQNRGGSTYTYLYLDYQPVTLQPNFYNLLTDPPTINGTQVYLPTRLTYPTGAAVQFTYTGYGQMQTIAKLTPALTGQGAARVIAQTSFNFPGGGELQPECPRLTWRLESAENWMGGAMQTYTYDYFSSGFPEVTDPSFRRFRVQRAGLTMTETILPSGSNNFVKKNETTYTHDTGLSYIANPRPVETKVTAPANGSFNTRKTTFGYAQQDGMWLPTTKDEYDAYQVGIYRRTVTSYTSYPARNILGLPQTVSLYSGAGVTLLSRVTNNYDQTDTYTDSNSQTANYFIDATADAVIQHDNTGFGPGNTQRGNVTSVTQFSVVNGATNGSRTIKRASFDTNGNLRAAADGANNRSQIVYTDNYSNKPGSVGQTAVYAYTTADPTGFRAGAQRNYYNGATLKTFNLLSGGTTELQTVTTIYDFADRPLQTTRPDGGWSKSVYWGSFLVIATAQQTDPGKVRYRFAYSDGAGRGYRQASDHPHGGSWYSGQITSFNKLGEQEDVSNVYAINGSWNQINGEAPLFTHLTYDDLHRLKLVTHPDGNTRQNDYESCGCAGTSETRVTDELGHYTITKTDFLGRLVEATEPNTSVGDGVYSRASYVYDELDRLVRIDHSNTTSGLHGVQQRFFNYDGYGRLQNETTPEAGTVSYGYKPNDLPETKTDARGIITTTGYNTRNLPITISYSNSTPAVSYGYDAYGARQSMTDGEGATTFAYNTYRQLESETRTFTGLSGKSVTLSYAYSQADQLKQVVYSGAGSGSLMAPTRNDANARPRPTPTVNSAAETTASQPPATPIRTATPATTSGATAKPKPRGKESKACWVNLYGTVTEYNIGALGGTTLTLVRDDGQTTQTTSASWGGYNFYEVECNRGYTLTPAKTGYFFIPGNWTTDNLTEETEIPFSGRAIAVIKGRVTNPSGAPVAGVTLTATGQDTRTATTDSDGRYTFNNLLWGTSYTVSPALNQYTFAPTSRSYQNVQSTIDHADFVGTPPPPPPPPLTWPFSKTINYAYNSVGVLASIGGNFVGTNASNTNNLISATGFRGNGALSLLHYGNGRRLQMGYNNERQQPISLKVDRIGNAADKIIDYAYSYYDANGDNNNRIRRITDNIDTAFTTDYTYDQYNRLTYANAPAYWRAYQYDPWGNITNNTVVQYNYDKPAGSAAPTTNRLASVNWGGGPQPLTYDAAGNTLSDAGQSFSYDGANRLKTASNATSSYGYDGAGQRARVTEGGAARYYVQSSVLGQPVLEVNSSQVERAYVYNGEALVAQQTGGEFY